MSSDFTSTKRDEPLADAVVWSVLPLPLANGEAWVMETLVKVVDVAVYQATTCQVMDVPMSSETIRDYVLDLLLLASD